MIERLQDTRATSLTTITLETPDPDTATAFYEAVFPAVPVRVRGSDAPTSGFRGFAFSLVVSRPATVDALFRAAVDAGASTLKPLSTSFWGYGGVLAAPDGSIWKVATSAKRDAGPADGRIDAVVLLLGAADVAASRSCYVEHGLTLGKSFGRKYVEFTGPGDGLKLALYGRKAAAKDVGVPPEGSGSHRIVLGGGGAGFTDPDGFVWEAA